MSFGGGAGLRDARPGPSARFGPALGLRDLVSAGWIVPPSGQCLRHRFELIVSAGALAAPDNLIGYHVGASCCERCWSK